MTCDKCWRHTATTVVMWKSKFMNAHAYWRLCDGCAAIVTARWMTENGPRVKFSTRLIGGK